MSEQSEVEQGSGVTPAGSGYSAEPEPSCTVSAVPVSIPNANDPRLVRRTFSLGDSKDRPRSISKAQRKLLRSFVDPIYRRLKVMPDDELWAFIEAGQSVSSTNCGWDEYAVCRTYLESAQWMMRERLFAGIVAAQDALWKARGHHD